MSWELQLLTALVLSVLALWWLRDRNIINPLIKATCVLVGAVAFFVDPRNLLRYAYSARLEGFSDLRLHALLVTHFRMALTLGAVVW